MTAPVLLGSIEVPSDSGSLPYLRQWMEGVWRSTCPGAAPEGLHTFVLALHEAFRNVIEHAYAGCSGLISVEAEKSLGELRVRLTHDGASFDGQAAAPTFDGTLDRGFGVYLMTRGLTRVTYTTTTSGRQQVELTKSIEWLSALETKPGEKQP